MSKVKVIENGDLFTTNHQTLTNAVNTHGVMGKGIALQFKKRFNGMYEEYKEMCKIGKVELGQPYLYKPPQDDYSHHDLSRKWVLNFPTKKHWRSPSRLDTIQNGLQYLREYIEQWGIESLAVPALGCGEGGLSWGEVRPVLLGGLERLGIEVELYAPPPTDSR